MHSIASIKSAGGAADYYGKDDFASADYYAGDNAAEHSEWGGESAEGAGVSGEVTKSDLGRVLKGELPSGEKVAQYEGRRPGYDLTFSAPKSVSLMAYVAGDQRILGADGAHTKAVRQTMAWIEKNLAETRTDIDGKKVPVKTGNLVYALVEHDTSRALDPQLHNHVLVANLTKLDGKWQALHADKIWSNNTVIGSIYHAFLRVEMEKLGYQIETRGKHGTFEIAGLPKDALEAFSQRRAEILKTAEGLGIKSTQGLRAVTSRTRDPKLSTEDRAKLVADWKERAAQLGFDPKPLLEAAERAASREGSGPVERSLHAIGDAVRGAREFVGNLLRSPDPLVDRGIMRLAASPEAARAQFAVASAVRIHAQREAAFDVNRLSKTALDLGFKGVTIDHVSQRIERLVEKGALIPGEVRPNETGYTMVTTREELAKEVRILERIEAGKGQATAIVPASEAPDRVRAASKFDLNPGQLAAATLIVSSEDRVVAIQGVAGGGKSTMLQAVAQTFEAAARIAETDGKRLHGLAFQSQMVADLKAGAGIEAQTIDSFIWQNQIVLTDPNGPAAAAKRDSMKGVILAVDEGSMVSNDHMLKLIELSQALGAEKLAVVGDRKQLSAINSGKAFSLIQAGGVTMERMDENLRQRTDTLKTVAALANVGKASAALRVLGDKVVESENPAREAADRWLALSPEERSATAVFASGREARGQINERIQAGLAADGTIKGEGLTLTVRETINLTREDLRYAKNYERGQILEVTGKVPELGLHRGTFNVSDVLKNGKVELEHNGRKFKIDPQKIDPKIERDRLELSQPKTLKLHEGDKIRWTQKDKDRDLLRSAVGRVLSIDGKGVTVETGKGTLTLPHGDRMLSRMDLAYSLNMHMAQGVTVDKAITVMSSHETNLSNQQLFNVAVTRVRDDLTFVVNNQEKLERQLDRNTGIKTSAMETVGRVQVDPPASRSSSPSPAPSLGGAGAGGSGSRNGQGSNVSVRVNFDEMKGVPPLPKSGPEDAARYAKLDGLGLSSKQNDLGIGDARPKEPRQLPVPEKNLGLEL